jgi:uncharacterized protein (TIGR02145 family)
MKAIRFLTNRVFVFKWLILSSAFLILLIADSCNKSITDQVQNTLNNATLKVANSSHIINGYVKDIDKNKYKTVKINSVWWMAENLKTTKYNDGSPIECPGTDEEAWKNNTTGAYSWYMNDEAVYKNLYGALYNWYAINTGKLCPKHWHVPTDGEWHQLVLFIDPAAELGPPLESAIAGGILKSTGTLEEGNGLWESPNTGATNAVGFSALPAGYRTLGPMGGYDKENGAFWTASQADELFAWVRDLYSYSELIQRWYDWKRNGFSVRCVKDADSDEDED